MRHIGHLPGGQARVFSDFLVSRGIRNEVERELDGSYSVWVHDEDQVPHAQGLLTRFASDPNASEFVEAGAEAERVRASQRQEEELFRKRVHTRQSVFRNFGAYGMGWFTYSLIVVCIIVFFRTKMGMDAEAMTPFFIADPAYDRGGLREVRGGEFWRLLSPILLHMNVLHILFNMMWLSQLGSMIEGRRGTLSLLLVVTITAVCSNLAQYRFGGPGFGGMSGVVYGLAGFIWIRGSMDRGSGLFLHKESIVILLVWMVICYAGIIPRVANTAHLVGLLSGMALGAITALIATRRL